MRFMSFYCGVRFGHSKSCRKILISLIFVEMKSNIIYIVELLSVICKLASSLSLIRTLQANRAHELSPPPPRQSTFVPGFHQIFTDFNMRSYTTLYLSLITISDVARIFTMGGGLIKPPRYRDQKPK